ncbi:hypothetical protein ABZ920_23190 [Streptomyces sp. NPDC046831]|uniref:hypothetical protein n=1 Tax=Streptomyces sp. NPDC046831 TaxID=3154805 RepID=UPI0033F1428E
MNLAPQVSTAELSDADLDDVSGGLAVGSSAGLCVETPVAAVAADVLAVVTHEGVAVGTAAQAATH